MKAQPAGQLLHFGLTSPLFAGLVVMAICLAGGWGISKMLPPHRRPVVEIIDVPGPVVSEGAAKAPTALDLTMAPSRESLTVVQSWAFESDADTMTEATDHSTAHSKRNKTPDLLGRRPDLLSAPQGWTYEASASE